MRTSVDDACGGLRPAFALGLSQWPCAGQLQAQTWPRQSAIRSGRIAFSSDVGSIDRSLTSSPAILRWNRRAPSPPAEGGQPNPQAPVPQPHEGPDGSESEPAGEETKGAENRRCVFTDPHNGQSVPRPSSYSAIVALISKGASHSLQTYS